jgi:hypothetical protein
MAAKSITVNQPVTSPRTGSTGGATGTIPIHLTASQMIVLTRLAASAHDTGSYKNSHSGAVAYLCDLFTAQSF